MPDQMQSPGDKAPLTARLFSIESMIWMAGVIFTFGTGFASLSSATNANTKTIDKMQEQQESIVHDISTIQIDMAGMRATQRGTSMRFELQQKNIDKRLERQQHTMDRVLDILQKNPSHTPAGH